MDACFVHILFRYKSGSEYNTKYVKKDYPQVLSPDVQIG